MLAASVMVLILMCTQTFGDDIWYDEVFSLCYAKADFSSIPDLTAQDVHPPFYYIYLKLIVSILGFIPGVGYISAAKLASVIPAFGLIIICISYLRKRYGIFVMGLSAFLLVTMPQLGSYYVEIRMYSLALLMITGAGLLALSIVEDGACPSKWICFCILGILTAYTQYYACIGIIGIYIALLVMLCFKPARERKSGLWWLLGSAVLSVAAYIPWLPSFFRQVTAVGNSYWILPLTLRSIPGCVKFIFLPVDLNAMECYIAAGLTILAVGVVMLINLISNRDKELRNLLLVGISPLTIIVLSGFLMSIVGRPIFVYRYMIPSLGLWWIMIAVLIDRVSMKRVLSLLLLLTFFFSAYLSVRGFWTEEHKKLEYIEDTKRALGELEEDAVLIANFDHVAASVSALNGTKVYLYEAEADPQIPDMLNGTGEYVDDEGVLTLVNEHPNVYFLGSFNHREQILEDWSELGLEGTEQASVLLERYWFNIYRISQKGED